MLIPNKDKKPRAALGTDKRKTGVGKFAGETFERLIRHKIKDIKDAAELAGRRRFIGQVKGIISRHPFVYVPHFIDDLLGGQKSSYLKSKYYIPNDIALQNIIQDILDLQGKRYRLRQHENAREMNMGIHTWAEKYGTFKDNCSFFADEMLEMLFYSLLCSHILLVMMDHTKTGISRDMLVSNSRGVGRTLDACRVLDDQSRRQINARYLGSDFERIANEIISYLVDKDVLKVRHGRTMTLMGDLSIDKVKAEMVRKLKLVPRASSTTSIRHAVTMMYPEIALLQNFDICNAAFLELEQERTIRFKVRSESGSVLVLLNEERQLMQYHMNAAGRRRAKFYGREVSPEVFVDELSNLKPGCPGDGDSQLTMMKGLVFFGLMNVHAPREPASEFDFAVIITNAHPHFMRAMKAVGLKASQGIFHCKVMINRRVTPSVLARVADALPAEGRGMIFTCMPTDAIPSGTDACRKPILVMGRDAIRGWLSRIRVVPCRKNSVARIRTGDDAGRLVVVKALNYKSGLATTQAVLDGMEILVPIGDMEEMLPHLSSMDDFETVYGKYAGFLRLLADVAGDSFKKGMYTEVVGVYTRLVDLVRDANPEMFDEHGRYVGPDSHLATRERVAGKKYVQFEHVHAEITVSKPSGGLTCQCAHMLDGSHKTLCHHLVAGLDYLCREERNGDAILKNIEESGHAISRFRFASVKNAVETLSFELGTNNRMLRSYLRKCASRTR